MASSPPSPPCDLLTLVGPPPVLPSLESALSAYLDRPDLLPIHRRTRGHYWPHVPQPHRLLKCDLAPVDTTLEVERDQATGAVLGFREVPIASAGSTAKNSTSLSRAPGPPEQAANRKSGNYPFWPGGFDLDEDEPTLDKVDDDVGDILKEIDGDGGSLKTCPPGFARGLDFAKLKGALPMKPAESKDEVINLASALLADEDSLGIWSSDAKDDGKEKKSERKKGTAKARSNGDNDDEIDHLLPAGDTLPVLNTGDTGTIVGPTATEWAEIIDISQPMNDFHQKVPQMAFTWPFELDTFQKQAVWRLERNESVFVAAHTSAGKTVVAEYAIALSQKHMTRTIYTSPIKALSNQKFRDFKDTFNDVGLVTGDIQINPNATCLIMTTEILRSMLYNGSDIIRDLEYVVFDEVHYINDAERGVVWEEVLILLPNHVNIIMLSATVPNTLAFADWVGRTKKKKIYVISTMKRPVPLEHFLYTGSSAKSKDERFLLQDSNGNFLQEGYNKAYLAKKERENKGKAAYGAKCVKDRVGPQQEKNILITLIDHLSKRDKLPVVVFTLSRNRIDQNASLLTSMDLTTSMEKSDIHHFIRKCVQRLKGSDKKLPQVLQLTELLKRGIGIHHSGILPILKEVVEMLFQRGLVKLLFATETFAMGVNMPARTVVFDNIRKHDGKEFRTLLPAEYIQMAGRAGRRGLDSTGTVIILCKNELHQINELHGMMQGKPSMLESKFRLTYSMILNLLRVEQLRVEDMMKRSFMEINSQKKQSHYKERVEQLKKEVEGMPPLTGALFQELERFYTLAAEYTELKSGIWRLLLSHPVAAKALVPGRVLVVKHGSEINKYGILLAVDAKSRVKSYSVMVLSSGEEEKSSADKPQDDDDDFLRFVALAAGVSQSYGAANCDHVMVDLTDEDVFEIVDRTLKVDADKIFKDIKNREIPRFRGNPPAPSTMGAVQELIKLSDLSSADGGVGCFNLVKDFRVQDMDLLNKLERLEGLKTSISCLDCLSIPDFSDQFFKIHHSMKLRCELKNTEYLMSEESLTHLPDYHNRITVLKTLKYIDEGDNHTVRMKGRVACEMGSHDLMITELVLNNELTDRPPAEIVALLSCMVFQQRNCSAPELTDSLKAGVKKIQDCAEMIGEVQKECGMEQSVQEFVEQFNFGLTEVAYEWARGMPFAEITQLTDVQEGVIVRTIQRLDETLRDVKDAARVIGDPMLYQKMDEASTIIKRDIVFAASLYTQ